MLADNDTQHGNILLLDRELPKNEPAHHKVKFQSLNFIIPC
jgi:hypothetical protein